MSLYLFRKKPFLFFIITLLGAHYYSFAQATYETDESDFFDHVRFGGSLGASFSDNAFSAFLAPKAVYDFNNYVSAGAGFAGSYTNADNFSAYSLSGSLIGLFRPLKKIQLSSEFEENYFSRNWELEGGDKKDSYWYPALFLGAGYTAGHLTAGIRYDVLYDEEKSIYGSALMPFVSVYF